MKKISIILITVFLLSILICSPSFSAGSKVFSFIAPLINSLGGTGQNSSGWTGTPQVASGVWSSSPATMDASGSVNIPTGQCYKINGVCITQGGSDGTYGLSLNNNTSTFAPGAGFSYGFSIINGLPSSYLNGTNYMIAVTGTSLGTNVGTGLFVLGNGLTIGSIYYYNSSGVLALARANAAGTMPGVCIANTSTTCVFSGQFRYLSSPSWTLGGAIYVSATSAGALVQSAPAVSGNQVQRVGIATAADTILIMPSLDVGTIQ